MKKEGLLKNESGLSIVLAIFVAFILLVCVIIINMNMGPVLMEVVAFSNSYMDDNPSELMGEWRLSLNHAMKYYAASTFILCFGIIVWMFITSIKKEYKTYYR